MDVYGTLPWSTLDQRARRWQDRKRWWLDHGVDDATPRARATGMITTGRHGAISGGVSRFDPHLAEVLITWFSPAGGVVLDPSAGGPVRGLVAGRLGRDYHGVDLLAHQVSANRARAGEWNAAGLLARVPRWEHGDALTAAYPVADYILTCPPYHNRERYSDDPRDLSAMSWPRFVDAYRQIIARTIAALRPDRFATWVVSDVRDHRGHLRGLPALTTDAHREAGAHLINEQVLIGSLGTRAKTMRPPWESCRTATRVHQHVLTYVKGDRRTATRATQETLC